MSTNPTETIFPCPLSKGYGIPARQAWSLLRVFLTYRFVLACLFIISFYSRFSLALFSVTQSELFKYSSQSFLALSVFSAICVFWRVPRYTVQAQILILTDILLLTLLMHACGGIKSGIGILLAVSLASCGLLIGGRCAMFFAALASLAVLSEQIYSDYVRQAFSTPAYAYAGMLGASFFTIALLSYILAKRSEQIAQIADEQQQTISNLEGLNQYIIQHLQSGIVITNKQQTIQMLNEAALRLINAATPPVNLISISAQLSLAFQTWLSNPEKNNSILLQLPEQVEVYGCFAALPTHSAVFYMISLQDVSVYNQRVQQSKLASLGRLTASIAHEIRNPLSAISHAGQLLSENPNLSTQDKRLTEIIQTHTVRVNHIIEDILQLSRRTDSSREKIELSDWLNDFLENFRLEQTISPDTFRLEFNDELLYAFIDVGHLKQIMDNLCENALRYGKPEQGAIIIRTQWSRAMPCIEVIDNGSGIISKHLQHLFEPFFTTSARGTGLGLYISRELAELNQAKLSYYLTDEQRTCFRLCLLNAEQNLIEL